MVEFEETCDDLNGEYKENPTLETDSKGTIDIGFLEDVDKINF